MVPNYAERGEWDATLRLEAEPHGSRMLPLHETPYIMGLPYRIDMFEKLLGELTGQPQAWFATGKEVVSAWEGQQ
jgi:allantoinase